MIAQVSQHDADEASCPHGFLSPLYCYSCMEDGNMPVLRQAPARIVGCHFSKGREHCEGCNLPIVTGDIVVEMSDGTTNHFDESCLT